MDTGTLILVVFLGAAACALIIVGIVNVRTGIRRIAQTQEQGLEPVWHKQPKVLFGINNVVFALLLIIVLLLNLVHVGTLFYVLLGLIGVTLLMSIVLVARSVIVSLNALKKINARLLQQRQQNNGSNNS